MLPSSGLSFRRFSPEIAFYENSGSGTTIDQAKKNKRNVRRDSLIIMETGVDRSWSQFVLKMSLRIDDNVANCRSQWFVKHRFQSHASWMVPVRTEKRWKTCAIGVQESTFCDPMQCVVGIYILYCRSQKTSGVRAQCSAVVIEWLATNELNQAQALNVQSKKRSYFRKRFFMQSIRVGSVPIAIQDKEGGLHCGLRPTRVKDLQAKDSNQF